MSTKIYDGIQISNMTLTELNDWCMSLRKEMKEIALAQFYRGVTRIAASIFLWQKTNMNLCPYYHGLDVKKLQERKDDPKTWDARAVFAYADTLAKEIAKRSANAKTHMDNEPDFDYEVSLSLFPLTDKILGIPYTTNKALKSCITDNSKVSEYGYWNNTDCPDSISEDAWEVRKKDWDEIFKYSGIPANCGMSIVLLDVDSVDWWRCPDRETIDNYIKPHLKEEFEYCKIVAKQKIMDKMWEDIKATRDIDGHEMSTVLEINQHVKEHPEEVEEEAKLYLGSLDFKTFLLEGLEYYCTNF